jgi:hypothetical protein
VVDIEQTFFASRQIFRIIRKSRNFSISQWDIKKNFSKKKKNPIFRDLLEFFRKKRKLDFKNIEEISGINETFCNTMK